MNTRPQILIAGAGNIFWGDDGFGAEVARRLAARRLPDNVKVVDFGIRGLDLAYALLDDYDAVILVDATRRGGPPGTLYVIEPEWDETGHGKPQPVAVDTHGMVPETVLRWVRATRGRLPELRLVGCEPATGDDMSMGLSELVQASLDEAVSLVEELVQQLLHGQLENIT